MKDSQNHEDELPPVSKPAHQESMHTSDEAPEIESYQIVEKIGMGGMATVWRALQLSTHREVALKVLGSATFGSSQARIRFEREIELTARLEHPNIARIYESGLCQGMYFYTMELFEGEHLDEYIRHHQLSQTETLQLFLKICQAVQYAHQKGVIHRDLKPSNIIVTKDGQPHILDFGLAKTLLESDKGQTVSLDGDVTGTLYYMSPEQAGGHVDLIDTRSDVYSLGIVFYKILIDHWPYDLSGSQYDVLKNIQEVEPIRPSKIIPHFNRDLEAILLKALTKESPQRYQSITELANDIDSWLQGLPVSARSISSLYLLRKLIIRHRKTSIIVGLLFITILNTSFISLYSYSRARTALQKSRSMQQQYVTESNRKLAVADQSVFIMFLEFWHDEKAKRTAANHFDNNSRERTGALFLIDPRPLAEKEADFRERFPHEQSSFWRFLLGEHYLKENNKTKAIEAYQQCIDAEDPDSEWDDWFRNRAKRKINELLNEGTVPEVEVQQIE